ncbi:MAG TPA: L,D-transpeptidase/peptidoglycan binding protein [Actinomycetota bacterium]|nr:L,D-transpeptidase/peptidoglycan binding protein [Actinomycetota bacterium]
MARGTHAPARKHRAIAIVAIVAGVLVLAVGGAAYSAYRYEQSRADRILPGVTVGGVDVGGMTKAEAVQAVRAASAVALQRQVELRARGRSWQVTLEELGQRSNAVGAVNRALGLSESMGTFSRFWHRFNDDPIGQEVELTFSGDGRVDVVLGRIARDVAVKPVNADVTYDDGEVRFVKPKPGRALDFVEARASVRAALKAGGASEVSLPVLKVSPKVTEKTMPRTIVVRVDENKLYLYDGFDVVRTWAVATAMPGWTTPQGDWNLYRKAVNPTWYNPALDSWGADLPAVVPGGPSAPMGTRALYITAPGLIRIHGTPADSSIGTYASHGCIRMHNWEVEELYPMVDVGTRVIVVGSRPANAVEGDTPASVNV